MENKTCDSVWTNALIVTCANGYGLLQEGALAVKAGRIVWVGSMAAFAESGMQAAITHDVQGACITPGLIDCHTHLVYAGNRAREFELRLQGVSYEEIAKSGGGIQSTVQATRDASFDDLLQVSLARAKTLLADGVTTVEIKSGYGLDMETELKILRVAKMLALQLPMTVVSTFLGAHTVPKEYREKPDAYLDLVCDEMIPQVASEQLATAVDVFCERIAFDLAQTERVFNAAKKYGLAVKCHAEQLSSLGATELAARYHALSVDHLEHLSKKGVSALAKTGTVAVLLPGAYYYLREKTLPPIASLKEHHIPIALATDCNPGTSPILSLRLILNMACTLFGLTPEEALMGATINAARALGLEKNIGSLEAGKQADFVVWNVNHPAELIYYMGDNPVQKIIKAGVVV